MSDVGMQLYVLPGNEQTTGRCACCGHVSRVVTGMICTVDTSLAHYLVHWTVGHIDTLGAEIDLIIGRWGDDASAADRVAVRLHHFIGPTGGAVMVQDPPPNRATAQLAARALLRDEVIGTPRADEVFALYDALTLQDPRLAELFPPAQSCPPPCVHTSADRARRPLRPRQTMFGRPGITSGRSRGR